MCLLFVFMIPLIKFQFVEKSERKIIYPLEKGYINFNMYFVFMIPLIKFQFVEKSERKIIYPLERG